MSTLILGAGGHAKVIADIFMGYGISDLGFLDDNSEIWHSHILGLPVLGAIDDYALFSPAQLIMGIGANITRYTVVNRLGSLADALWIQAVHRHAVIGHSVQIGKGSSVAAGAIINADTIIGRHSIINTGATIDHDCAIGDFVHIAPGAHLAGGVKVGDFSFIGMGANILPYLTIGSNVTIGAGATVVKDVPQGVIAKGVPARW